MKPLLLFFLFFSLAGAEGLDPSGAEWTSTVPIRLALHRTPPLDANEAPVIPEIATVELRVLQVPGRTFIRLAWKDASPDNAGGAPNQFVDACAVMTPARPVSGDVFPSLQMGDADHPVVLYFFDLKRGAAVMDASGRGTTRRTGKTFPARSVYGGGSWQATLELPELAAGTPISVALWNGSQNDRDGKKYFSIWRPIP